jgi:hypothetical protein
MRDEFWIDPGQPELKPEPIFGSGRFAVAWKRSLSDFLQAREIYFDELRESEDEREDDVIWSLVDQLCDAFTEEWDSELTDSYVQATENTFNYIVEHLQEKRRRLFWKRVNKKVYAILRVIATVAILLTVFVTVFTTLALLPANMAPKILLSLALIAYSLSFVNRLWKV